MRIMKRVLIADDLADQRALYVTALVLAGFVVDEAADGGQVIDVVTNHRSVDPAACTPMDRTVERERQDVRSEKRRRRIVEFLTVVGVVALAFFVWFGCRRSAPMTRSSP